MSLRSHKTVEIMVYHNLFLLLDGRIQIRIRTINYVSGYYRGPKAYRSYGSGSHSRTLQGGTLRVYISEERKNLLLHLYDSLFLFPRSRHIQVSCRPLGSFCNTNRTFQISN
jgi:hypothetical protein